MVCLCVCLFGSFFCLFVCLFMCLFAYFVVCVSSLVSRLSLVLRLLVLLYDCLVWSSVRLFACLLSLAVGLVVLVSLFARLLCDFACV